MCQAYGQYNCTWDETIVVPTGLITGPTVLTFEVRPGDFFASLSTILVIFGRIGIFSCQCKFRIAQRRNLSILGQVAIYMFVSERYWSREQIRGVSAGCPGDDLARAAV